MAIHEHLTKMIEEREVMKKEIDLQKFVKNIRLECKVCHEIVVKPPAGENYRLEVCKIGGQDCLILYGGLGYEMFSEVWTIPLTGRHNFDIKWKEERLKFDIFTSDKVSLYQSSFTVFDTNDHAVIYGGTQKIGKGTSFITPNEDIFMVDLNSMSAECIGSLEGVGPGTRRLHSVSYLEPNFYIIGGLDSKNEPTSKVWKLKISRQF